MGRLMCCVFEQDTLSAVASVDSAGHCGPSVLEASPRLVLSYGCKSYRKIVHTTLFSATLITTTTITSSRATNDTNATLTNTIISLANTTLCKTWSHV